MPGLHLARRGARLSAPTVCAAAVPATTTTITVTAATVSAATAITVTTAAATAAISTASTAAAATAAASTIAATAAASTTVATAAAADRSRGVVQCRFGVRAQGGDRAHAHSGNQRQRQSVFNRGWAVFASKEMVQYLDRLLHRTLGARGRVAFCPLHRLVLEVKGAFDVNARPSTGTTS